MRGRTACDCSYTLILMYGAAISLLRDREGLLAVLLARVPDQLTSARCNRKEE